MTLHSLNPLILHTLHHPTSIPALRQELRRQGWNLSPSDLGKQLLRLERLGEVVIGKGGWQTVTQREAKTSLSADARPSTDWERQAGARAMRQSVPLTVGR